MIGDTLIASPSTCALTPGSDDSPQKNYVYILQSDKILTCSTSDFPTNVEHVKVGYFLVPSAAYALADGIYINQNWENGFLICHNLPFLVFSYLFPSQLH